MKLLGIVQWISKESGNAYKRSHTTKTMMVNELITQK